jgi:hypothetical protein
LNHSVGYRQDCSPLQPDGTPKRCQRRRNSQAALTLSLALYKFIVSKKRIGLNHPEAIAKAVALPMKIVSIVTAPFIWLLTHFQISC